MGEKIKKKDWADERKNRAEGKREKGREKGRDKRKEGCTVLTKTGLNFITDINRPKLWTSLFKYSS